MRITDSVSPFLHPAFDSVSLSCTIPDCVCKKGSPESSWIAGLVAGEGVGLDTALLTIYPGGDWLGKVCLASQLLLRCVFSIAKQGVGLP